MTSQSNCIHRHGVSWHRNMMCGILHGIALVHELMSCLLFFQFALQRWFTLHELRGALFEFSFLFLFYTFKRRHWKKNKNFHVQSRAFTLRFFGHRIILWYGSLFNTQQICGMGKRHGYGDKLEGKEIIWFWCFSSLSFCNNKSASGRNWTDESNNSFAFVLLLDTSKLL